MTMPGANPQPYGSRAPFPCILFGLVVSLSTPCWGGTANANARPFQGRRAVEVVAVDELVMRGTAISSVEPLYPSSSLAAGRSGVAVAELRLSRDGTVREVKVVEAPDTAIASAVTVAAKQWKFSPVYARVGSERHPVEVDTKLTFYFKLEGNGRGFVVSPKAVVPGEAHAAEPNAGVVQETDYRAFNTLPGREAVYVVDIRSRPEFRSGHIPGSVNIPADEIGARASELPQAGRVAIACFAKMEALCTTVARTIAAETKARVVVVHKAELGMTAK